MKLFKRIKKNKPKQSELAEKLIPLPAVVPKSRYDKIPGTGNSFESKAKKCAMGDPQAMLWMFRELRSRLTDAYRALEADYIRECCEENLERLNSYLQEHRNDRLCLQGAHLWLNRAAFYGSEKAQKLLEENGFYRQNAYFQKEFQMPGQNLVSICKGADMRKIGFLDFEEKVTYHLKSLNTEKIYIGSCYVSYDRPDDTGFGMEDEYDYYFFDEFFRLLFILRGWSKRDIQNNQDRITAACREKRAEKQLI